MSSHFNMSYRANIRVYHGNCTGDSVRTYLFLNGIVETSAVMGKRVLVKMSMIYRTILDKSGARRRLLQNFGRRQHWTEEAQVTPWWRISQMLTAQLAFSKSHGRPKTTSECLLHYSTRRDSILGWMLQFLKTPGGR